jgi:hypothetical protein
MIGIPRRPPGCGRAPAARRTAAAARWISKIVGPSSIYRAIGFAAITINGTAGGVNQSLVTQPLFYTLLQVGTWV